MNALFLDCFGTLASLLATYYFIRLNKLAWLVSLAAIGLNGVLYWQKGIYADTALEGIYFLSTVYGWFKWRRPMVASQDEIGRLSYRQGVLVLLAVLGLYVIIYSLLTTYTNSTVASLDALTAALSLVAQWLMCYKIILTWGMWLVTDVIYGWLYWGKSLPFHAVLMGVYTVMALVGYWSWSKRVGRKPGCKQPGYPTAHTTW